MNHIEIKWKSPDFEYTPKDVSWYWVSIIATILVLAVAVWQKNFLFGFFIVLGEILIIVWANKKPQEFDFTLNEDGLTITGQKPFRYDELSAFSVAYHEGERSPELTLMFQRRLKPRVRVYLPKDRARDIEKVFRSHLPQSEPQHSLIDDLQNFFRF